MIKKILLSVAVIVTLTISGYAKESKPIQMTTVSYQQIVVKDKKGKIKRDKNGKPIKKWVKTAKVVPGDIIKYVDTVTNDTNKTLKNAKITNPINEHLTFVAGSVKLMGVRPTDDSTKVLSSEVRPHIAVKYSVDGGKSYDVAENLFIIGKDKKKHPAQPKHYNAILFEIDEVPAHSKVDVEFKVKLK